ncbi:hypothetical protein OTU49_008494 [Cherax quadricarinatus]|uniref:Uncharacterized protein n=1 Tax=Cherax quadricarinatus TaxID=27406 RepID=A0AAW0WPT9_CHEQU|nr:uncharacterized protein LOC128699614 [Cherax quadricarinatus]
MNPVTTSVDDLQAAMSYLRNRLGPNGSVSVFLVPKIPSKNTNLNKNSQSRTDDMENKRPEPDLKDSDAVRICGEVITISEPVPISSSLSSETIPVSATNSNVNLPDIQRSNMDEPQSSSATTNNKSRDHSLNISSETKVMSVENSKDVSKLDEKTSDKNHTNSSNDPQQLQQKVNSDSQHPQHKLDSSYHLSATRNASNSPSTPGKQVSDTPSIVKVSGSDVEFLDSSAKERLSASEKERVGSVKEGVGFVEGVNSVKEGVGFVKEGVDTVKDGVGSSAKEGMDSSGKVFGISGMSDNVLIASQNYHSARARRYNLRHSVHQPVRFSSIVPTHFQQGKIVKTRKRKVLTITLPPLPQITESELLSLFYSLAKIHKCEMKIDGSTVNEARLHTQRKPLSCIPHQLEPSKNLNNFSVSNDNGHYHTTTASNNGNNEISPCNSINNLIERLESHGTRLTVTRDVSHMSNNDVDLLSLYPEIVMGSPSAHTSIAFNRY